MSNETTETRSHIMLSATKTFTILIILASLIGSMLVGLNIYQFIENSNLKVEIERVKVGMFLETQELVIDKFWLEKVAEYGRLVGKDIIEVNETLANTLDELGQPIPQMEGEE